MDELLLSMIVMRHSTSKRLWHEIGLLRITGVLKKANARVSHSFTFQRCFFRSGSELRGIDTLQGAEAGGVMAGAVHEKFFSESVFALGYVLDEIVRRGIVYGTVGGEIIVPAESRQRFGRLGAGRT